MSKVNLSTQGGQLSELQKLATADLPTGTPVQPTPEPSPAPSGSAMDQLMAGPAAQPIPPDLGEAIDAGAVEAVNVIDEQQRQTLPTLQQRFQQQASAPEPTGWLRSVKTDEVPLSQQVDGGINGRAEGLADAVRSGRIEPSVSWAGTPGKSQFQAGDQIGAAETISEAGKNPFLAAVTRSQGLTPDGTIDPNFVKYGSYITENAMADLSFASPETEVDDIAAALGQEPEVKPETEAQEAQSFTKGQGDEQLGQKIHQEWSRAQTQGTAEQGKLPPKEAAILGAAFKDMWARQNPTYIKEIDNPDGAKTFQLTSIGQTALEQGAQLRARVFNQKNVRPLKQALELGKLPGQSESKVKDASGRIGDVKFGAVINEARKNFAQVPNVVDKQRAKILLSTFLPVLADPTASRDPNHPNAWMAEINNIGPSKYSSYVAAEKAANRKMQENPKLQIDYNKDQVMNSLIDKVAQEVQAIAQERNGANYLTYYTQAFNGRISPQQTFFNPTSSKAVRFVTRNATPSIAKPGTRVEKNLRQMYAMMLVKGADALLPDRRDAALVQASPQLEKWGDLLASLSSMTDAEYEAVAQAIADGKPLDDPAYQAVKPMQIDDPELVNLIKSKGEDGPHFIDGLIDFAKYQKAKRKGQPYASYFNAYIDGKTNGIASNGIQMGSMETALTTGVLRKGRGQLLDDGDIRDQVKALALESIDQGWDGDTAEFESELNIAARAVYSDRNFNKHTTMTFGYGKEIASFGPKIEEVIGELSEGNPELAEAVQAIPLTMKELSETILGKYTGALEQALSKEAIDSRKLMRSAAALHSAANQLFSIKSYTGMDLALGRDLAYDPTQGEESQVALYTGEGQKSRVSAYTYEREATSSAARSRTDEEGTVSSTPGEYAYGGSLPAPVQSLDAATVALSAAGKSWDRLKVNSGGNPYMHSIYDAFKTDANGFDVIVEEVNKNWLDATGKWSYLKETYKSTMENMKNFSQAINKEVQDNPNRPLRDNEKVYMEWILSEGQSSTGNPDFVNLRSRMQKLKDYNSQKEVNSMLDKFSKGMASVGYNMKQPPAEPTVRHLQQFVQLFAGELNLRHRMDSMINTTETKKKALLQEIKRNGYKTPSGERIALQYYAH